MLTKNHPFRYVVMQRALVKQLDAGSIEARAEFTRQQARESAARGEPRAGKCEHLFEVDFAGISVDVELLFAAEWHGERGISQSPSWAKVGVNLSHQGRIVGESQNKVPGRTDSLWAMHNVHDAYLKAFFQMMTAPEFKWALIAHEQRGRPI